MLSLFCQNFVVQVHPTSFLGLGLPLERTIQLHRLLIIQKIHQLLIIQNVSGLFYEYLINVWFSWGFCLHCVGAEDKYRNDTKKAELPVQLGLTYSQLQLGPNNTLPAKIARLSQALQSANWQTYMYSFFHLKLQNYESTY